MRTLQLLVPTLEMMVRVRLMSRPIPSDEEIQRMAPELAQIIAENSDALIRGGIGGGGKKAGEVLTALAEAVALLALQPGGVKLFGKVWKADRESKNLSLTDDEPVQPTSGP